MAQVLLPPDPNRTNVSLTVAGEALPVRLLPEPPDVPSPPSQRLRRAWSLIWNDIPIRWLLIFVLFGLVVVLATSYYFSLTLITSERSGPADLGYTVEYPSQPVVRENEQFSITLVNHSPISFTHVSAALVFNDALPVTSDTTVAQFESLAPGERKTRVIHFFLNQPMGQPAVQSVQLALQVSADQVGTIVLDTYTLKVAPFPWIKTIGRWVGGVVISGLSGIVFWMLRGAFKDVLPEK